MSLGLTERREVRGKSSVQHAIVFLDRESVDAKVRRPGFPHTYKEYQSTWTHDEIVEQRTRCATLSLDTLRAAIRKRDREIMLKS